MVRLKKVLKKTGLERVNKERFLWLTKNAFISKMEKSLLSNINTENVENILEVGCGEGANIYNLTCREQKVVGIDIIPEKLNLASVFLKNAKFACADALRLPFKDQVFDVVFCKDVLHHVLNKRMMLSEMCRVCRQKGKIIIIEANGKNLFWNIFGTMFSFERGVKQNTIRQFQELLSEKSFGFLDKVSIRCIYTPMILRLLTHYKFGLKNFGNSEFFLRSAHLLNTLSGFSIRSHWAYIVCTAVKREAANE